MSRRSFIRPKTCISMISYCHMDDIIGYLATDGLPDLLFTFTLRASQLRQIVTRLKNSISNNKPNRLQDSRPESSAGTIVAIRPYWSCSLTSFSQRGFKCNVGPLAVSILRVLRVKIGSGQEFPRPRPTPLFPVSCRAK
jgi:hypothetical protein